MVTPYYIITSGEAGDKGNRARAMRTIAFFSLMELR
jgi:hypothetical protein